MVAAATSPGRNEGGVSDAAATDSPSKRAAAAQYIMSKISFAEPPLFLKAAVLE